MTPPRRQQHHRSAPLAERKADVVALDGQLAEHRKDCTTCRPRNPCDQAQEIKADLAAARDDIKYWFDPGPDQGTLL